MIPLTEEEMEVWEAVPREVKARLRKLLADIQDAGVDGGMLTSCRISTLKDYQKDLTFVL